jgi:hypothetical protein
MAKSAHTTVGKQKRYADQIPKKPARTFRDLRIAAMAGDRAAMRALLRRHGFVELASEIRRDKPIPSRVAKMIAACTAGTGTHDQPGSWDFINDRGEIESLLLDPPPQGTVRRAPVFED